MVKANLELTAKEIPCEQKRIMRIMSEILNAEIGKKLKAGWSQRGNARGLSSQCCPRAGRTAPPWLEPRGRRGVQGGEAGDANDARRRSRGWTRACNKIFSCGGFVRGASCGVVWVHKSSSAALGPLHSFPHPHCLFLHPFLHPWLLTHTSSQLACRNECSVAVELDSTPPPVASAAFGVCV